MGLKMNLVKLITGSTKTQKICLRIQPVQRTMMRQIPFDIESRYYSFLKLKHKETFVCLKMHYDE